VERHAAFLVQLFPVDLKEDIPQDYIRPSGSTRLTQQAPHSSMDILQRDVIMDARLLQRKDVLEQE
jgi:hypothetical protein